MPSPFAIDAIPLSYVEEGALPLTSWEHHPLMLLTDGNTSEETTTTYRFCLGRDDIELYQLSERPDLVQAYLFVMSEVRRAAIKTCDGADYAVQSMRVVQKIQRKFRREFPEFFEDQK